VIGMDEAIGPGSVEDLQCLQRRAEEELETAQRSTLSEVTAAHYELAAVSLERIEAKRAAPSSVESADEPVGAERAEPVADRAREIRHACKGWSGR